MDLSMSVPLIKDIGAIILKHYLPTLTLHNEINDHELSRDASVLDEYRKDVLRHHKINAVAYLGAKLTQKFVFARASQIQGPILMLLSEADPIVSSPKNKSLFELIGSSKKVMKIYPDRKHEIFNDLGRAEVFADIKKWIKTTFNQI